jgi:inner membrane protein
VATPVGHSLAGFAVSSFFVQPTHRHRISLLALVVVMANAPDLDFIPGILIGKPALYHHGITHSLGLAVLISLAAATIMRIDKISLAGRFRICFLAYVSHLVLDLFGPDERFPYGIPLLWPVGSKYFISPVQLFLGVRHAGSASTSTVQWIGAILHPYNLGAIAVEILLVMPFIFLARYMARHQRA